MHFLLLNLFLIFNYFDTIVNGISFLILFSDCSLLVCKKTIDFCTLNYYSVTLLYLFISSNSFCVDSLEFSVYEIMSFGNRDNFTSLFPNGCLLFLLSCSVAWLAPLIQCWIEDVRRVTLSLLILVRNFVVFLHKVG